MNLDYYIPINDFEVGVVGLLVSDFYPHRITVDMDILAIKYFFKVNRRLLVNTWLNDFDFSSSGPVHQAKGIVEKDYASLSISKTGKVFLTEKK